MKKEYIAPLTEKTEVELESGICAGSIEAQNPNQQDNGRIEEHEVNENFDFTFVDQDWD